MKPFLTATLGTIAVAGFVVVLAPILVIALVSFSADEAIHFPPSGFSLRWFGEFFAIPTMRASLFLSVQLAVLAATIAAFLGMLASLHLTRARGFLATAMQLFVMAPLVFPSIVLGLALLLYFRMLGIGVFTGLLLAHVTIGMPYAFRLIFAQMQSLDPALPEAAQSLGSGPLRTFVKVTLPLIWPGVLAGWLFAFIVSLGELNMALFLTSPQSKTLPIEIFGFLQFEGNQLVVAAASMVQIALILVAMLLIESVKRAAARRTAPAT
jgi:putative spermidine/putrescine transport system permease protein